MKIHHLNCGSLIAPFIKLETIVYCLLVETSIGLVLIDTGFGTNDYSKPGLKMQFFLKWMSVPRLQEEIAFNQVQGLGYKPEDVKHIIMTHLHVDHAGGLSDFPWAKVHVFEDEYRAIQNPQGMMEFAYVQEHWSHQPDWMIHKISGEKWFEFEALRVLETLEVDFYLIPLPGHTRGHCGVAVGKPGKWLLHCGDASSPFYAGADLHNRGSSAYGLNFIPRPLAIRIMGAHVPRLRSFLNKHEAEVKAISAHDIYSFKEYNSPDK